MVNRSREETAFCAYLIRAIRGRSSVRQLLECLDAGARGGLWDARIPLDDGTSLWLDYDGGYFHTLERRAHDVAKTERKLRERPEDRVCRIRAGAPPMPDDLARECAAPCTDAASPWKQLADARPALSVLLPEREASKLAVVQLRRRRWLQDAHGKRVLMHSLRDISPPPTI